eukprot:10509174-Prorocentrum_lima.AAC.1
MSTIARPKGVGDTSLEDLREDIASLTDTGPPDVQCHNSSVRYAAHTPTSRLVGNQTWPTLKEK